jgi:hypothetical protein
VLRINIVSQTSRSLAGMSAGFAASALRVAPQIMRASCILCGGTSLPTASDSRPVGGSSGFPSCGLNRSRRARSSVGGLFGTLVSGLGPSSTGARQCGQNPDMPSFGI